MRSGKGIKRKLKRRHKGNDKDYGCLVYQCNGNTRVKRGD